MSYQILLMSKLNPGMTLVQSIEAGDSKISGSFPGR